MLDRPVTDAQSIIENVVQDHFPAGAVHGVHVMPDPYMDGEDYLQVIIEVDEDFSKKHAKKAIGLTRHIRPKLTEINETRFPVVRYVLAEDAEILRREAG